jgi:DNA-binding GntR family transcriptional regulator
VQFGVATIQSENRQFARQAHLDLVEAIAAGDAPLAAHRTRRIWPEPA